MASASSAGYQRQIFPRSEAGNLSDSDHKATYELPPGIYDGRDTYISLKADCVSPAYSPTSTPSTDSIWLPSPAGAVYPTQLVLSRDDLDVPYEDLNAHPKACISADPAQMIRYADLRFERIGTVHHVQDVSMWKRVFDEIIKTPNRKKAEATQRGISVGADTNEIFYSPFQTLRTDEASTNRQAELRANVSEILPILSQNLDTRAAGQTFIETFMDLSAVTGVSQFYPLVPRRTISQNFANNYSDAWGGKSVNYQAGYHTIPKDVRRPRFYLPGVFSSNTVTDKEIQQRFSYGNKVFISGIDSTDGSMNYRFGTISGYPVPHSVSGKDYLVAEVLDMQARLPDSRSICKEVINQRYSVSISTSNDESDAFFKHCAVLPQARYAPVVSTPDSLATFGNTLIIPGCYTSAAECGYFVGQHVVVPVNRFAVDFDSGNPFALTQLSSMPYSETKKATYQNFEQDFSVTNTIVAGLTLQKDGTVLMTLKDDVFISSSMDDIAKPYTTVVVNGAVAVNAKDIVLHDIKNLFVDQGFRDSDGSFKAITAIDPDTKTITLDDGLASGFSDGETVVFDRRIVFAASGTKGGDTVQLDKVDELYVGTNIVINNTLYRISSVSASNQTVTFTSPLVHTISPVTASSYTVASDAAAQQNVIELDSVDGLYAGLEITHAFIPPGTTITSVNEATTEITISKNLTGQISQNQSIVFYTITLTAQANSGVNVLQLSNVANVRIGQTVTHAGIPADTLVVDVDETQNQITLSANTTTSIASGDPIDFSDFVTVGVNISPIRPFVAATTKTTNALANSGVNQIVLNSVDGLSRNQPVKDGQAGIPSGVYIIDINVATNTITLSSALTAPIQSGTDISFNAYGSRLVVSSAHVYPVNGPKPALSIGATSLEVKRLPASVSVSPTIATLDYHISRNTLSTSGIVNFTMKSDPSADFMILMFPQPNPHHPTLSSFNSLTKYRVYVNNAPQTPFDVVLDPRDQTTHLRYVDQFLRSRGIGVGDLSMQYQLAFETNSQKMHKAISQLDQTVPTPEQILCIPVLITPGAEQTVQFQLYIDTAAYTSPTFEVSVLERRQKSVNLDPSKMLM